MDKNGVLPDMGFGRIVALNVWNGRPIAHFTWKLRDIRGKVARYGWPSNKVGQADMFTDD